MNPNGCYRMGKKRMAKAELFWLMEKEKNIKKKTFNEK
jgi:hypothetical protein